MKKVFRILSLLLVVSFLFSGCTTAPAPNTGIPKEKITIALDWLPNTNHTGIFVAKEKGYFDELGLDVNVVQAPEGDTLAMLAAGEAQFGVSFQEYIASALNQKDPLPVKAVAALIQHNTSGIMTLKKNNINGPKDLEGKRYGGFGMALEELIIKNVVEKSGGDFSKVKMVRNNAIDNLAALKTDIDAVWVYYGWDVIGAQVKNMEVNYFAFKDINPVFDFYTPLLASSDDFLSKKPDVAKKFLQALAKGYEYAISNPKEAAQILVKNAQGTDPVLAEKSQEYLATQYKAEVPTWGLIDEARWTRFYKWMYENKVITKDLGSQGFTNDYLTK